MPRFRTGPKSLSFVMFAALVLFLFSRWYERQKVYHPTMKDFAQIHDLMTEQQVEAILGPPHKVLTSESDKNEFYRAVDPDEKISIYYGRRNAEGELQVFHVEFDTDLGWVYAFGTGVGYEAPSFRLMVLDWFRTLFGPRPRGPQIGPRESTETSDRGRGVLCAGLTNWAQTIAVLNKMGVDLTQYKTTEEILSRWKNTEALEARPYYMERDYWGRPYDWSTRIEGERTIVRVTSYGRNGINENGEADDLYVEVTIVKNREPQVLLKDQKGELRLKGHWDGDSGTFMNAINLRTQM